MRKPDRAASLPSAGVACRHRSTGAPPWLLRSQAQL